MACCATKVTADTTQHHFSLLVPAQSSKSAPRTQPDLVLLQVLQDMTLKSSMSKSRRQPAATEEEEGKVFCHLNLHSITFSTGEVNWKQKNSPGSRNSLVPSPALTRQSKVSSSFSVLLNVEENILLDALTVLCRVWGKPCSLVRKASAEMRSRDTFILLTLVCPSKSERCKQRLTLVTAYF